METLPGSTLNKTERIEETHLPFWTKLAPTQFTDHVLEIVEDYNVAEVNRCHSIFRFTVPVPNSIPQVDCLGHALHESYCLLMQRIFKDKTLPSNITVGFNMGDYSHPSANANACLGSASPQGKLVTTNMETVLHMKLIPKADWNKNITEKPWEARDPIPVFRGTGWLLEEIIDRYCRNGTNATYRDMLGNPLSTRFRAVDFSGDYPHLLNAKLSGFGALHLPGSKECIDRFPKLHPVDRIDKDQYFANYQVALVLHGIGAAFRLNYHLRSRQAVVLAKYKHELWYTKYMEPYVHYIPLAEDLSDLGATLHWIRSHPGEVRKIGENGHKFYETYLTYARNEEHMYELVYRLAEYHDSLNTSFAVDTEATSLEAPISEHENENDQQYEKNGFRQDQTNTTTLIGKMENQAAPDNFKHGQDAGNETSTMEFATAPKSRHEGFIDDVNLMCQALLTRANNTREGEEPWRLGGLHWKTNDCGHQGRSILGNHLSRWYMMRGIAAKAGVTVESSCDSPVTNLIRQLVSPNDTEINGEAAAPFSWKSICEECVTGRTDERCKYSHAATSDGLDRVASAIRSDLGEMAQKVPSDDFDDVAIHLRTGDIARQKHSLYGLVPFKVYTKLIPPGARSIGIIAAPFKQAREGWGHGDSNLNEAVVTAARDYIQQAFPEASVSIRNNESETMDVAFARMIKADWLICGPSTFCVFPAVATMGESFILHSPLFGGSPTWLDKVAEAYPQVHYIAEKYIPSTEIWDLNVTDIVKKLQ